MSCEEIVLKQHTLYVKFVFFDSEETFCIKTTEIVCKYKNRIERNFFMKKIILSFSLYVILFSSLLCFLFYILTKPKVKYDDGINQNVATVSFPNSNIKIDSITNTDTKLPPSFDFRKDITKTKFVMKNQGDSNLCWAYALAYQAEASIFSTTEQKIEVNPLDIVGATFSNYNGDTSACLDDVPNVSIFTGVLGVSKMSSNILQGVTPSTTYYLSPLDVTGIKQKILQYNAACISLYWSDNYYNKKTNAYYNTESALSTHEVCIIGWDDNFDRKNFKQYPKKNGAWLIVDSMKNFTYWVSYEDLGLLNSDACVINTFDKNSNNFLLTDGTCYDGIKDIPSSGFQIASIFNSDKKQTVSSVYLHTLTTNIDYKFDLYTSKKISNNTSDYNLLSSFSGKTSYAGNLEIPLPKQIKLKKNQNLIVVVSLTKTDSETISLFIDQNHKTSTTEYCNKTESGQNFYKENVTWIDFVHTNVPSMQFRLRLQY